MVMKINNSDGLSLTELLIASVIIGIMMTGIGVFSVSVKQLQGASETTMYTNMKLTALIKTLRMDAERAIGDPLDPGILSYTAADTSFDSICFRQDTANTPDIYTDDIWVCWYIPLTPPGNILRCFEVDPSNVPVDSLADCNSAVETREYFELDNPTFYSLVRDADNRIEYITITLTAHNTDHPLHVVKNPSVTMTTKISPAQMSR
ncbi:MAG: prepilin-type N-terminal cleavage/methylation domain-containing protein [Candidatus Omnitrophica bacterium]|nr:prepilin-type N-terminal cleavage/methylation domain-containing protein [Candidatus Omnitrophota bacterium]